MDRLKYGASADTIFVLFFAVGLGALLTSYQYAPGGAEWLPAWAATVWAGVLTLSATLALVGVLWRGDEIDGWNWEIAGRPGLVGTCLSYAWGSALNLHDAGDFLGVVLFGGIAVASAFRAYGVAHRIRLFRLALRAQESAGGRL